MAVALELMTSCSMCGHIGAVFEDEDLRGFPRDDNDPRKRISPSAERNKESIRGVVEKHLTKKAKVLEVGSGTGQHCAYLASNLTSMQFQPSEWTGYASPRHEEHTVYDSLQSIDAHCEFLKNVRRSVPLDVGAERWEEIEDCSPRVRFDAVLAINLMHISAPQVKEGLFKGAARVLNKSRGLVLVYGPFSLAGDIISESNAHFDNTLRSSGHEGWGIIDTKEMDAIAAKFGFEAIAKDRMPANEFALVYAKCSK